MGLDVQIEKDWRKYPDLYHNLDFLRRTGYSISQIGMIYSTYAMSSAQNFALPFSGLHSEKAFRSYKREYQRKTREYFANIKILANKGLASSNVELPTFPVWLSQHFYADGIDFIEEYIARTFNSAEEPSAKVGAALISGAKRYVREVKGNEDTHFTPSLFKEYNMICYALKRELKAKAKNSGEILK